MLMPGLKMKVCIRNSAAVAFTDPYSPIIWSHDATEGTLKKVMSENRRELQECSKMQYDQLGLDAPWGITGHPPVERPRTRAA
jgi:hypothetical protein